MKLQIVRFLKIGERVLGPQIVVNSPESVSTGAVCPIMLVMRLANGVNDHEVSNCALLKIC
jgi:hypothetical protein